MVGRGVTGQEHLQPEQSTFFSVNCQVMSLVRQASLLTTAQHRWPYIYQSGLVIDRGTHCQ